MVSLQPRLWRYVVQLQRLHQLTCCSPDPSPVLLPERLPSVTVCRAMSSSSPSSPSHSSSGSSVLEASPQISLSALKRQRQQHPPLQEKLTATLVSPLTLDTCLLILSRVNFRMLEESLDVWRAENKAAIWLHIPLSHSHLISCAAGEGFQFHHAEGSHAMMKMWLRAEKPDSTPRFATHQLGVSGIVVREDTREVLVVQDKNRPCTGLLRTFEPRETIKVNNLWKFPGGLADLGEDIDSTAVQEVFEETGVKTEFQSVLAFRQQHRQPGAFGRSDIYVLCRLRPLTFDLRPCDEEILQCRWMTVEELRSVMTNRSSLTVRLTDLVLRGLDEGFEQVDILQEQHRSIYRGMTFKLFFRSLGDDHPTL